MYIPEELEDFVVQRNRAHSEFREALIKLIKQHEHDIPPVDGYYLQLLNGRNGHCEEIEEIGFKGPCIGPLKSCHITYLTCINLGFVDESSTTPTSRMEDGFGFVDGLLYWDGKYYGDFELALRKAGDISS